jgi:hypothetical protein
MSLDPGTTLGPYSVTAKICEGGMGEVYQARDTTLDRDVALKVLPEAFTSDPDRLARFEREAKVLASLNHPSIGTIYGLEEAEGVKALVLELIEGPTLEGRIKQGPIPDGRRVAFGSENDGMFWRASDGTGAVEPLGGAEMGDPMPSPAMGPCWYSPRRAICMASLCRVVAFPRACGRVRMLVSGMRTYLQMAGGSPTSRTSQASTKCGSGRFRTWMKDHSSCRTAGACGRSGTQLLTGATNCSTSVHKA